MAVVVVSGPSEGPDAATPEIPDGTDIVRLEVDTSGLNGKSIYIYDGDNVYLDTRGQIAQNIVVTAIDSNGNRYVLDYSTDAYSIRLQEITGEQTITVAYEGEEATFPLILVTPEVTGIVGIEYDTDRTLYSSQYLDQFASEFGLVVTASYNYGENRVLRNYDLSVRVNDNGTWGEWGNTFFTSATNTGVFEGELRVTAPNGVHDVETISITQDIPKSISVSYNAGANNQYQAFETFDKGTATVYIWFEHTEYGLGLIVSNYDVVYEDHDDGLGTGFRVGDRTVGFSFTEGGVTVDGRSLPVSVTPAYVTRPIMDETTTYYGDDGWNTKVLTGFRENVMFITVDNGISSTIDGGTVTFTANTIKSDGFTITINLNQNYYWRTPSGEESGTNQSPLQFTWNIVKGVLNPTLDVNGEWTYAEGGPTGGTITTNGVPQELSIVYHYSGTTAGDVSYSGTTFPTEAGEYQVYITVPESEFYQSAESEPVNFVIKQKELPLPSNIDGSWDRIYSENPKGTVSEQQANVSGTDQYSVTSETGTVVGEYDVTFTITDSNYKWLGLEGNTYTTDWNIDMADNSVQVSVDWTYGEDLGDIEVTQTFGDSYTYEFYSDASGTNKVSLDGSSNAGDYWIKVTVEGTNNYNPLSILVSFSIDPASVELPIPDSSVDYEYTGGEQTFQWSSFDPSTMQIVGDSDKQTNAGNYKVTGSIPTTTLGQAGMTTGTDKSHSHGR